MYRMISDTYKHLKFYNRIITVRVLLWGIFGGFAVALVASYYNKVCLGRLIKRLLEARAVGKERAVTLDEIDVRKRSYLKRSLREGSFLRKIVHVANPEESVFSVEENGEKKAIIPFLNKKQKYVYDYDKMKLYIPEEQKALAENKYSQKNRFALPVLIISVIFLAALTFLIENLFLPDLLRMLDNFIDMQKSTS